ncbi:soluble NSF attachment protein [Tuber brumale]|nr:soluble NSF attachment protein [Tuber brumale]
MAQDPRSLLAKADKQASSARGGFSLFGGKQDKLEMAADLYTQAANAFRLQKLGREAGQTLEKAAAIRQEINEPDDAASNLVEAYKAYKKDDPSSAARVLEKAIQHFTLRGNFRRAAGYQQNLAELLELEIGDVPRAVAAYELAGDWFQSDGAESLANGAFLKMADLAALEGMYPKAVEKYEGVARSSAENNLMKWSMKDYFLKAGICHLASRDKIALTKALDSYVELDPAFRSTREFQLLNDMLEADNSGDAEVFADKIFQYDQMSKLDRWKTTMLLRVKNSIEEEDDDGLA